jgi:hypothetical protein
MMAHRRTSKRHQRRIAQYQKHMALIEQAMSTVDTLNCGGFATTWSFGRCYHLGYYSKVGFRISVWENNCESVSYYLIANKQFYEILMKYFSLKHLKRSFEANIAVSLPSDKMCV